MQLSPSQRELDRGLPLIIKQPFSNARGVAEKCGILFDLSLHGKGKHKHVLNKDLTVDRLKEYFSAISTDPDYKIPHVKHTVSQVLEEFTEWHIFRMLDTIHPTVMGLDGIPEWFIRIAAAAFSRPVTHLFNMSLNSSVVPSQWKASRITPIPKTAQSQHVKIIALSPSPRYCPD